MSESIGEPPMPVPLPAELPEDSAARHELVDGRLAYARAERAAGDRDGAVAILTETMRAGLWAYQRLWSELWSLMESPADYAEIRRLWLESPRRCHGRTPLLRTVARAASVAGEHDDARGLLRKAMLLRAGRMRRLRSKLGVARRRTVTKVRNWTSRPDPQAFEFRAATALEELNAEFERLGVRAFLISGTLLGQVRDGGFIGWDKDIDLGFFTSEIAASRLEQTFEESATFNVRRLDFNTDRLRVNHDNGMMVDIFPHYEEGGKIWHDGTATRWWNRPFGLTTIEFLGKPQYVPDPPEQYLDDNYGNWREPAPNFDARLDCPNVEITDKDFFDTLLYFALLDAINKRNEFKRQRYVSLLRQLGENGWLDRLA